MKTISKYEAYAIKALRTMGVREDLAGFDYTVEAVRLVLEDGVDRPIQWTKKGGVYEKVAEKFGMSDWHGVERCIRYTIDMLKKEGDPKHYRKVLDVAAESSMNVGAYTSAVANYVRLQAYEEPRSGRSAVDAQGGRGCDRAGGQGGDDETETGEHSGRRVGGVQGDRGIYRAGGMEGGQH